MFSGIYPLLLDWPICSYVFFPSNAFQSFVFVLLVVTFHFWFWVLSISWIWVKFLLSLIFCIFLSLFYIIPHSYLLFPYLYWLWALFIFLSLVPLGQGLECLFGIFLVSWGRPILTFLFKWLLCIQRFKTFVFLFSLVSEYYLISLFISLLAHWLFSSMLFSLHVFVSSTFSCNWYLISYHWGWKSCLVWF